MKQTDAPLCRMGEGLADRKAGYSPEAGRGNGRERPQVTRKTAKAKAARLGHDLGGFRKVESGYAITAYYRAVCHTCGLIAIAEEALPSGVERRATEIPCGGAQTQ